VALLFEKKVSLHLNVSGLVRSRRFTNGNLRSPARRIFCLLHYLFFMLLLTNLRYTLLGYPSESWLLILMPCVQIPSGQWTG